MEEKRKKVSYSQFKTYWQCARHYYLDYIKGLRKSEDSISTTFGTGMHETIQLYIETLYKKSVEEADKLDLKEIFKTNFDNEIKRTKIELKDEEYKEFCEDGNNIIEAFTNTQNRIKHFPTKKYEFIGIEDEIVMPIRNNIEFICYIDVVLKEKSTGRYRIIDIKTSTQGWNKYQTSSTMKIDQVLLYKTFYARKYNVDIDMIDIEFFILRRKLWENYSYPQSRIQVFSPKNNKRAITESLNRFGEFIDQCFTEDGKYIDDEKLYEKNPGERYKNCRYCVHKGVNCFPTKDDIEKD